MTLAEIKETDEVFLTPSDIATVLGSDAQTIRDMAKSDPAKLGFQVTVVVIGGTFSAHAASAWLTNKREERKLTRDAGVDRAQRRADQERASWANLVNDRDKTIRDQAIRIAAQERQIERLQDLLTASEGERRKMMEARV